MKHAGSRREAPLTARASGAQLALGARLSETLSHLAPSMFFPKGVYRYRTHEEANQHAQDCLVRGMARLAKSHTK